MHKKGRPKSLKEGKHLQIDHPSGQGKQPPASALGQIARPETRARPARRKYQCASSKLNNPHLLPHIKYQIWEFLRCVARRASVCNIGPYLFCSSVATSSSFTALLRPDQWAYAAAAGGADGRGIGFLHEAEMPMPPPPTEKEG